MSATGLRAARLQIAMRVLDMLPDYRAGLYREPVALLGTVETAVLVMGTEDDTLLAHACLEAEQHLRRREWEGLEDLLAAIPPGGDLEDVYDQPADVALRGLRGAQVCGWLRKAAG